MQRWTQFEWHQAKSDKTEAEQGIGFAYASSIFEDERRLEGLARPSGSELRFYATGKTPDGEVLTVIYTWRHYGEERVCRIISARKARSDELGRYQDLHQV